ncbi:MAG: hypothetical protein IKP28_06180 [Clostridia bacterium]|nr:hypothetical protein [Clostridia bacterium]
MKTRYLLITILCLILCLLLTGCGQNEEKTDEAVNNDETKNTTTNATTAPVETATATAKAKETDPKIEMANVWMNLPENVDITWKNQEKGSNDYEVMEMYKRGNDVMQAVEYRKNGKRPTGNNLDDHWYLYDYQGDYKWKSYYYYESTGWGDNSFGGNYPASPENMIKGDWLRKLNTKTDKHETIDIEGYGKVDTIVGKGAGTDGEYTYYYSEKLGISVKVENDYQVYTITKFDTKVSSNFPHALPAEAK